MDYFIQDTKYVGETISILVDFADMLPADDTILGVPTVTPTTFTGIDPTPTDLLYESAQVHNGTQVEQRIWKGLPGVIYNINIQVVSVGGDTFEKECYLAIILQDGGAISPVISFYYTSRPYPVEYAEIIQNTISPNYFHLLLNPRWTENIKSNIATQDSILHIGAIYYFNYPAENIQTAISPFGGFLISISIVTIVYSNYAPEGIKNNIAAISGTLDKVVIYYINYQPEEIKSNIAPQSGTLI